MKKILIVCGKLNIGGAEKVAYSLGHYRDVTKYECHYIVFEDIEGEYEAELSNDGCKIFHLPIPAENYFVFWKKINQLMKKYKYDVVHCHTMFNSGIVLTAAKRHGISCRIAHSHSICSSPNRKLVKRIYEHIMRYLILKNATDYVGCGQKAGEWLFGEKEFKKNGKLIYNGVDTALFAYSDSNRHKIRKELGITNKYVIGHVGHLAEVKNQIFLISLMPQILKCNPDAILLLIGDGNDRSMLQNKIKGLGLMKHVIMTGNVMNVNEYLSALDVFAFPSLYEGMPLSIIEVQANGLPCVISDRIPKDVVLTDLITVLPLEQSAEKWIDTIIKAKRENSQKYREIMYQTGFDTKAMVDKVYEIYENSIGYVK